MRSVLLALAVLVVLAAPASAAPGWSLAAPFATPRHHHTATLLRDGSVLVAGGSTGAGPTRAAERYFPATNTWRRAGTMVTARSEHAATLLPNGKVLVAGGQIGAGAALSDAELYDPGTNTWSAVANMATARRNLTTTLLPNGRVLAAGGFAANTPTAVVELFNPATSSWSPGAALSVPRAWHTATRLANGDVLMTGGFSTNDIVPSTEIYRAATGTWLGRNPMGTKRAIHQATLLANGRVLVTGGGDNVVHLGTAEIYNPATNTWAATPPMLAGHNYHGATRLPNGRVLVTGGVNAFGARSQTSELYDPATNAWSFTTNMAVAHAAHASTLLTTGQVFVTGGDDGTRPHTVAERFTPSTTVLAEPAVSFDDQAPGAATTGVARITNTGDSPLLTSRLALGGAHPGDFAVISDSCSGVAVPSGGSCAIGVRFAPAAAGARSATLTFEANTAAVTHAVSLLGRGIAAPVSPPIEPPVVVEPPTIVVTLGYLFSAARKSTRVTNLAVKNVPAGSTVTVTCRKGCARKKMVKRNVSGTVRLKGLVKKRLKVGVKIVVVVSKPGSVSAQKTLTIRRNKAPLVSTRCIAPGATRAQACG